MKTRLSHGFGWWLAFVAVAAFGLAPRGAAEEDGGVNLDDPALFAGEAANGEPTEIEIQKLKFTFKLSPQQRKLAANAAVAREYRKVMLGGKPEERAAHEANKKKLLEANPWLADRPATRHTNNAFDKMALALLKSRKAQAGGDKPLDLADPALFAGEAADGEPVEIEVKKQKLTFKLSPPQRRLAEEGQAANEFKKILLGGTAEERAADAENKKKILEANPWLLDSSETRKKLAAYDKMVAKLMESRPAAQ